MVKSASRIADKQVRRAEGATDDFREGVSNPERNPIEAAIAANAKRIANLQESIKNKTWENSMSKLSQADWQNKTANLGASRYAEGVRANKDKVDKFWSGWQPILQGVQNNVNAMADVTEADREKKMIANSRALKAQKGKWRG